MGNRQLTKSRLQNDIRAQADSLARAFEYHRGDGDSPMLEAASLIRSFPKVLITGMGASLFAAIPFQYFLCARGIDATLVEAGELLHYLHHGHRDALMIIVSRSGESVEVARLLSIVTPRQKVIGLTNEPRSLLGREAHLSLSIHSLPDEFVAIQTYAGTLLALHLLAAAVDNRVGRSREEVEEFLPAFAQSIEGSMDHLRAWDSFLVDRSPVHLLARGPSTGSALEGALLFNEVAKHPAISMPIASFRHGPVELVDQSFRGLVFAPLSKTRDLTLSLVRDLERFGGQIRVIGPSLDESRDLIWCDILESPETLTPLLEIIPVQAAALRMAQLCGIAPGSFRYAPQIALDEATFLAQSSGPQSAPVSADSEVRS
jgi:glutamine---fructose-6-phosphate transaminase (isomerizing)